MQVAFALLLFTGCIGDAAAQGTQKVQLTLAGGFPPAHIQASIIPGRWAAEVEKVTNGRVVIKSLFGGSLLGPTDTLDGVRGGIADLGVFVPAFWPGQFPLTSSFSGLFDLGLGGKLDLNGSGLLAQKLYEEFPAFTEEYKRLGLVPLVWLPTVPQRVISTVHIKTLSEFNGVKVRAFGKYLPKLLQAVGAVPVNVSAAEVYSGLQSGVIRGSINDPLQILSSKIYEPARYILNLGRDGGPPTATAAVYIAVNAKSWSKISPEDQQAILAMSRKSEPMFYDLMAAESAKALASLQKDGVTVTTLSDEDVAKWVQASPHWYELIATDLNAQKLPGTEIVKRYQDLVGDYAAGKLKR
jgi:TRAP-type C4-dicarboxylate transport system substrate-binding protein